MSVEKEENPNPLENDAPENSEVGEIIKKLAEGSKETTAEQDQSKEANVEKNNSEEVTGEAVNNQENPNKDLPQKEKSSDHQR